MHVRLSSLTERFRASLFFVPLMSVVAAVVLAEAGILVDSRVDLDGADLPLGVASTVESARAVLSTVAAATITFAGIAFSVSLLTIQLASSQYSPRVVHTLFRDPFNKRVMGLVVGTFTFCLVVLRSVRSSLEQDGTPVIPNLSVAVAVVLGVAAILALVAFIDHSAHTMDVSEILERVSTEALGHIRRGWPLEAPAMAARRVDGRPSHVVRFDRTGWVQQIDTDAMLECAMPGGVIRVRSHPGRYAVAGTPICAIVPRPDDPEATERRIRAAVVIDATRTMQQDAPYGLRQLVDVAVKALSPGVNDPTTAQDAIFHVASVLVELLRRNPPPAVRDGDDGRQIVLDHQYTHDDVVALAFDEVRLAAAGLPTVCVYLLEAMALIHESLADAGLSAQADLVAAQAGLVVAGCAAADVLPVDLEHVRAAHGKRFGAAGDGVAVATDAGFPLV